MPDLLIYCSPSHKKNPFSLHPEQESAVGTIIAKIKEEKPTRTVCVLSGYAGTGKTTVMKELKARLEGMGYSVLLLAPTGKAAARLKEATGANTATIHSYIYTSRGQIGTCPSCGKESEDLGVSKITLKRHKLSCWTCPNCNFQIPIAKEDTIERELGFSGKKMDKKAINKTVVIIDEASMVDVDLAKDIERILPNKYSVLYVGDEFQIPPVGSTWGVAFDKPTARLTQIHRQKEGSPILDLATRIRERLNDNSPFSLSEGVDPGDKLKILELSSLSQACSWLARCRQDRLDATLLSCTNKVRQDCNREVRKLRGILQEVKRTGLPIVKADRVLVLGNNKDRGVKNGEVFIVESSSFPAGGLTEEGFISINLYKQKGSFLVYPRAIGEPLEDWHARMAPYTRKYSQAEKAMEDIAKGKFVSYTTRTLAEFEDILSEMGPEERWQRFQTIAPRDLIHVDFGECITVHKAQGSQWRIVGIIWDKVAENLFVNGSTQDRLAGKRWLYTAVTRASEYLVIFFV